MGFIFQVEGQHFRITVRGQVIHGHAVAWLDNPMGPVQNVNPVVDQDRFGIAAVIPQGGYTRSVADIVIIYDHMQANRARIVEDIRQKIAKGRVAVCHRIGLPVLVGDGKTDGVEPVKFYLVQDVRVGHRPQATGLSLPRLGAVPAYAGDRPHLPEPVHDLISAGMPCLSPRRHRAEDHETRKSENCAPVERSIVRFYLGHVVPPYIYGLSLFPPSSLMKTRTRLGIQSTFSPLLQGFLDWLNDEEENAISLVLGTSGSLRGIPVQIRYQPNWWFQVILNLCPEPSPSHGD